MEIGMGLTIIIEVESIHFDADSIHQWSRISEERSKINRNYYLIYPMTAEEDPFFQ